MRMTRISVPLSGLLVLAALLAGCGGSSDGPPSQASAEAPEGIATTATAPISPPRTAEATTAQLSLNEWGALYCGALDTLADRPFTPAALEEISQDNDATRFGNQLLLFAATALDLAELFDETEPPAEAASYHRFMTEFLRSTGLIWRAAAQELQTDRAPTFMRVMEGAAAELRLAAVRVAADLQESDVVDAAVESACPSRFALEAGALDEWAMTFCGPLNDITELVMLIESEHTPLADVPVLVGQLERSALRLGELAAIDEETQVITLEFAGVYGALASTYFSLIDAVDRVESRPASERAGILSQAEAQFTADLDNLERRRILAVNSASSVLLASIVRAGCFQ